jgi:hypothetical protein
MAKNIPYTTKGESVKKCNCRRAGAERLLQDRGNGSARRRMAVSNIRRDAGLESGGVASLLPITVYKYETRGRGQSTQHSSAQHRDLSSFG